MSKNHVLQPLFMRSLLEICAVMGVGKETVYEWIESGAPIAVERCGKSVRYSAEAVSLQAWRCGYGGRILQDMDKGGRNNGEF